MTEHGPCAYVEREIGTEPDTELKSAFFEDPTLVAETVELIETAYGRPRLNSPVRQRFERFLKHEPAGRALAALACNSCQLKSECRVRMQLKRSAAMYNLFEQYGQELRTFGTGPYWLQQGRRQRLEHTGVLNFFDNLISRPEVNDSPFMPVNLLGAGISFESESESPPFVKHQLPELKDITRIADDTVLSSVKLTTETHQFVVVDARHATGLKNALPSEEELKVLYGKFLGRLVETTASGSPHILEPDDTMQKTIARLSNGRVDELRMSGKNRLYITVHSVPGHVRIVLLGVHGGDAATQRKFIAELLA